MSVLPISTDMTKLSQSAFFMLYCLLKGTSCGEIAVFILIAMGLCCDLRIVTLVSHTDGQY